MPEPHPETLSAHGEAMKSEVLGYVKEVSSQSAWGDTADRLPPVSGIQIW